MVEVYLTPEKPLDFVLLYAAAMIIAVIVLMRKPRRHQMLLRLKGGSSRSDETRDGFSVTGQGPLAKFNEVRDSDRANGFANSATEPYPPQRSPKERPLNVVFNYNGHSWDAYEVLGLPAGSSLEMADRAYQDALATVDETSRPFLSAAHSAIRTHWSELKRAAG